jgi:hypothetical protein
MEEVIEGRGRGRKKARAVAKRSDFPQSRNL